MKTRTRKLLAVLAVISATAGCTDQPDSLTGPTRLPGVGARFSESGECLPSMIICDDGSEPYRYTDDGYEEVYADFAEGEISFDQESAGSTYSGSYDGYSDWAGCPSYVVGVAYGNVLATTPSGDKRSVRFMSRGTWSLYSSLGPNMARYNWPPGYWDAIDGSGAQVQIGSVEGICRINDYGIVYVSFTGRYHHFNVRWPRRRGYYHPTSGGGGSGGGGGDGSNCWEEHVVVEVNYGDGTGWHVIYEGTATVCE